LEEVIYQVLINNKIKLNCRNDQSILDAALSSGISLPYSCKDGRCENCLGKITSNNYNDLINSGLSNENHKKGYFLACLAKPQNNISIKIEILEKLPLTKIIPVKINKINFISDDGALLSLRKPPSIKIDYLEGQYLDIIYKGLKRSYSILSLSNNSNEIKLLIKKYNNGFFSNYIFNEAKLNDLLRIEVPKGSFYLRKNKKISQFFFLATGTGISPIFSILNSKKNFNYLKNLEKIIVIWGQKNKKSDLIKNLNFKFKNLKIYKLYSRENNNSNIKYVQDKLKEIKIDNDVTNIYACGSENMIDDLSNYLYDINFKKENFYTDKFLKSI